jgi:8-oxo-dGTP pyrophosphatase MutT (NUDIX family)
MNYGEPINVATVILRRPDGKLCVTQRQSTEANYPGHWEFPGGKQELNEWLDQTAEREVHEELGIQVLVPIRSRACRIFECNGKLYRMHFFLVDVPQEVADQVQPLEADDLMWRSPGRARVGGTLGTFQATEATRWALENIDLELPE